VKKTVGMTARIISIALCLKAPIEAQTEQEQQSSCRLLFALRLGERMKKSDNIEQRRRRGPD
jgi:hypothetical protein